MNERKAGRIRRLLRRVRIVLLSLKQVIIGADVRKSAVFFQKASRNDPKLYETETFVQMPRRIVIRNHGVKLQDGEPELSSLRETVGHKGAANTAVPAVCRNGVAGVADMSAAADVVGMENVKADKFP